MTTSKTLSIVKASTGKFSYIIPRESDNGFEWTLALDPTLPLPVGAMIISPVGSFRYTVLGVCCRLFDRDSLPFPYCLLRWRCLGSFWRRLGKRFVCDRDTKKHPSYWVMDEYGCKFEYTLWWVTLPADTARWWNEANRYKGQNHV